MKNKEFNDLEQIRLWKERGKLEVLEKVEKYIRRQNFNGTSFRLKSNIINRLRELAGEKLI